MSATHTVAPRLTLTLTLTGFAIEQPQLMSSYSVSDAVATYL